MTELPGGLQAPAALQDVTRTPADDAGDPTIAAAGDIACDPVHGPIPDPGGYCQQLATAGLLVAGTYSAVLALGDEQYDVGSYDEFEGSYDPTWGLEKPVTYPVPGNHEYLTAGAAGYFQYFGAVAGDPSMGYYSFNLGHWHIVALNANCADVGGCEAGSPEEEWLRADLAAHPAACTLAFWHQPRFTSGGEGNNAVYQPFWQALYDYHADIVLNGHTHAYERFAQQDPNGTADASEGIREFVVGTGGADHGGLHTPYAANTEVNNNTSFGILALTLHPRSYSWQFIPIPGDTFTDAGSAFCHSSSGVTAGAVTQATESSSRRGTVLRWRVADATRLIGFTLYAGKARVGPPLIAVHAGRAYTFRLTSRRFGVYRLRVHFRAGRSQTVEFSPGRG